MFRLWVTLVLLGYGSLLLGQNAESDEARRSRISRTTWHSAVLPGWGQLDNRKWWKVPLVYGALGTSGYFVTSEGAMYREYRDGYRAMTDDDPSTTYETSLDAAQVLERRDFYRSNLEQSILTFVLLWGVQVVDAHVDAHLLGFDVSEDLGYCPGVGPTLGISLSRPISGASCRSLR